MHAQREGSREREREREQEKWDSHKNLVPTMRLEFWFPNEMLGSVAERKDSLEAI